MLKVKIIIILLLIGLVFSAPSQERKRSCADDPSNASRLEIFSELNEDNLGGGTKIDIIFIKNTGYNICGV